MNVLNVTPELIAEQEALEQESLSVGMERYFKQLEERPEESGPIHQLVMRSIQGTAEAIRHELSKKGRGKRHAAIPFVEGLEPEVLAFHVLRGAMGALSGDRKMSTVAIGVGVSIMEEILFRGFRKTNLGLYKQTQEHIKKSTTGQRRQRIMRRMEDVAKGTEEWSTETKLSVGLFLMDCLLGCSTLFETRTITERKNHKSVILAPSQDVLDWLSDAHCRSAAFQPLRMPMVVPPRPWSRPWDGGYLTRLGGRQKLVKTRRKSYLNALEGVDLDRVYEALNAIQDVPWSVNEAVLSVAMECWDKGIEVGSSLPARDKEALPAMPCEPEKIRELREADRERYKEWAQRAAAVHERNAKMVAKRMSCATKLNMAERFVGRPIWFPHCMDFRGRVYPVPAHLSPQGDDLAKALLKFHVGKPITERGIWWLKVHIANCFGVDKVAFDQRVAWVDANIDRLLDSGIDPMNGQRFWTEADDPFLALAACFELLGASIEGPDYVSHISIPMDGSCNGLQNFSALLRDEVGGAATNLMPGSKPSDIYSEVARVASAKVHQDAIQGDVLAMLWDGNIDRKMVKQPVMTLPYGATKNGMRMQIEQALKKNKPQLIPKESVWNATCYLANVVYDSIGEVVIAARAAMDWLQAAAKVAASEDCPVQWTSPIGLPIVQAYRKTKGRVFKTHVNGSRFDLVLPMETDVLDKRRQTNGISPNLIHSFDSSHLMSTVLICLDNQINTFALIHDSYGTHACNTDLLHQCIRTAFIEQYSRPLLEEFRDELAAQLSPDAKGEIPPLPEVGNLDLSLVLQSNYFFA